MTLEGVAERLSATDASLYIQSNEWIVPTVQSVHILAICVIMSSTAMLSLRMAGLIGRDQALRGTAARFLPWVWWALLVQVFTGTIMIVGEPARELLNWVFWVKMALLLGVVLLTVPVPRVLEEVPFRDMAPGRRMGVRAAGLAGLAMWVLIVVCGRWIAYI
jgi:magnesium-transporting ATPase (P-type)